MIGFRRAALAGTLLIVIGWAGTRVGPDATPPARLAVYVDAARALLPYTLGAGAVLPFRLVEARCATDGQAGLVFESAARIRFYVVVSAPPPADSPDPVTVVRGLSAAEFADDPVSRELTSPCA